MNKKGIDLAVLIFFILFAGILSIILGQSVDWDLANYHIYNPYAFLTGRIGFDIFPAGPQSYLNPLIDTPYFLMVKHLNNHPVWAGFLQGQYYAAAAFLIYKTADLFFLKRGREKLWLLLFSVIIGTSGVLMIFEIGTTFNDIPIAVLILGAIYIHIKYLFANNSKKRTVMLALAGFLIGTSAGLKLTGMLFVVSEFMVLCLIHKQYQKPVKIILCNMLGMAAGFLLTNGYWMWVLYSHFGNPFMPFYNDIFRSADLLPKRFDDPRYMPSTFMQVLFYPFYWNSAKSNFVFEHAVRDLRYVAVYISMFIMAFIKPDKSYFNRKKELFLIWFTVLSYIVWINKFSILRYIMVFECLSGLLIMTAIIHLKAFFKSKKAYAVVTAFTALIILGATVYSLPDRKAYGGKLYDFYDLGFPDNAIVLIQDGFPSPIWIPFQNPKARFVTIPRTDVAPNYLEISEQTENKIKDLIKEAPDNVYIMYSYYIKYGLELKAIDKYLDTSRLRCRFVKSGYKSPSMYQTYYKVCH